MESSWCWKLPLDIQTDILNRLPAKTLISLKLVSWEWYHVISYLCLPRLSPPSPAASFCGFVYCDRLREGPTSPYSLRLAILHGKSIFRSSYNAKERLRKDNQPEDIRDCCNGILLVVHHDKDGGGGVHYSVYNPTTFESIRVPRPPHDYHTFNHHNTTMCCFASLVFDPTKSLNYKIISTLGGTITNPLKVETFSSETGKWSRYVVNIDSKLRGVEWIHCSAYSDGRLYRLLNTNYIVCVHEGKSSKILKVQAIGLPYFGSDNIYIDGDNCYASIGISNRCLHYSTRDRNGSTFLVYMLKDDVGWILKYTISIDDLLANRSNLLFSGLKRVVNKWCKESWFNFYAFHPNCDDLFLITPCEMLFYSPKEKLLELFHIEGGNREIVVGRNYSFPYSYCPVRLQSGFQRTLGANLGEHERRNDEFLEMAGVNEKRDEQSSQIDRWTEIQTLKKPPTDSNKIYSSILQSRFIAKDGNQMTRIKLRNELCDQDSTDGVNSPF